MAGTNQPLPISACITTKNNEDTIEECLSSVSKLVDEIVVVDSNSTDNTLDICQKYGCEIFQHKFSGIPDMKRHAMSHSTNEWVFILDSDEVVPRPLRQEIREEFRKPGVDALYIEKENYMSGEKFGIHPARPLVGQQSQLEFREDYIMEHLIFIGEEEKTTFLDNRIIHYAYNSVSEFISKQNQYTSLEALRILEKGKQPSWLYFILKGFAHSLYYLIYKKYILKGREQRFWASMSIWFQMTVYQKMRELQNLKNENPEDWKENWLKRSER